jgi:hypothetical protein
MRPLAPAPNPRRPCKLAEDWRAAVGHSACRSTGIAPAELAPKASMTLPSPAPSALMTVPVPLIRAAFARLRAEQALAA